MSNTEAAFHWIVDLLESQKIVYKISGGLAARLYGATRPLADIDIEVAEDDVARVAAATKSYIIFGPARYRDENWDLTLLTLSYQGQEIDIASSSALIFNRLAGQWEKASVGPETQEMSAFGRLVPVETKVALIAYKEKLGRPVDTEDIREINGY